MQEGTGVTWIHEACVRGATAEAARPQCAGSACEGEPQVPPADVLVVPSATVYVKLVKLSAGPWPSLTSSAATTDTCAHSLLSLFSCALHCIKPPECK